MVKAVTLEGSGLFVPVISYSLMKVPIKRKQENMADMMNVRLSSQAAAAQWGEGALLSFNGDEAHLHLAAGQEKEALRAIQRGAPDASSRAASSASNLVGEGGMGTSLRLCPGLLCRQGVRELDFGEQSSRRPANWPPCSKRPTGCAR